MATKTIRILTGGGNDDDYTCWWSETLQNINNIINNSGIPTNAEITKVSVRASADYDGGIGTNPYKAYLKFGFGTASSISTVLLGETRITKEPTYYPSDSGLDVTKYFSNKFSSFGFSLSYGERFVTSVYTSSALISRQKMEYADAIIEYTIPSYTLTVTAGTGAGTVTGGGTYERGSTATLTATPATGYAFKQWNDGNTDNPRTITVTGTAKYTATFEVLHCKITTAVSPSGSGTVTGGATSAYGSTLTLTARPATGYKFVKWNDGNTDNPRTVTVTHNATYTATFEKLSYTISANVSPSGAGTVEGAGTYEYGSTATLTATPATGYKFVKWNDGTTAATRTILVTKAATYTATFENAYIPVYVKTSQCQAVYIDETNKTIYFYGIIDYDTDEGGFDTVDGWHFKATRTIPTGTNIKLVEKIYIGTTRIL